MTDEKAKVADRLRGLCSRREYCRSEVMKKALTAFDGDEAAAAEVVESLVMDKYVDDLRYASAFARDKSSIAGWGDVKIRYMLSSKGIPKEIVAEALEEIDEGKASEKLRKVLETKAKALKDDPQKKLKLIRFALGRGYEYEDISHVIPDLIRDLVTRD